MRFDVFTLFPAYFSGPLSTSILKRAIEAQKLAVCLHDIRDWTDDKHRSADDTPFGGGAGMILRPEPVAKALESVLNFDVGSKKPPCPIIYLSPQGRTLNQGIVEELASHQRLALLCGHYEGIDERALEACVTDEISLGDFVLTGGEGAAAILIEAVARFVPGVLGNETSAHTDSFADGLLEAPHYTRPASWRGREVPEILLSGHHAKIAEWRFWEGVRRTIARRPDLIEGAMRERPLSRRQQKLWRELQREFGLEGETPTGPDGPTGDIQDESGLNSLG